MCKLLLCVCVFYFVCVHGEAVSLRLFLFCFICLPSYAHASLNKLPRIRSFAVEQALLLLPFYRS